MSTHQRAEPVFLSQALEDLRRQHRLRSLPEVEGLPGKHVRVEGRACLNLSSNNYLGLAGHARVRQAAADAALRHGAGAGGSRLLGGGLPLHAELEAEVTRMRPLGKALLFNTGFMANLGVLQALAGPLGPVFSDKLNHASVAEALRQSPGPFHRYRHADLRHLESLLAAHPGKPGLVCSETLFSMDGDFAPLGGLLALQARHGFCLYLDEAHSAGTHPDFPAEALRAAPPGGLIVMGTFGKAFGGFGAYVAASADVIDYLVNTARAFIFSTALPPAVAAGNLAALRVAEEESWRREKLGVLAERARERFRSRGLDTGNSRSHILPVLAGSSRRALRCAALLREAGFHAPAIRPPTVPPGAARLRISLTCEFEPAEIDALAEALERALAAADPAAHGEDHG